MKLDKLTAAHRRRMIGVVLHRWHRRLGAFAGLFLLWLAGSGIVLNHGSQLGLDRTTVSVPWVTRLYGLREAIPDQGFMTTKHWLVGTDAQTVIDGRPLASAIPGPLGLVAANNLLFAANASTLAIFDAQAQPVDTLRGSDLPVPVIHRIGSGEDVVVIADEQDQRFASRDGLAWTPYAGAVDWTASVALPAAVKASAAPFLRPRLPAERVLLDAHSGHILGRYGPFLVDTVGVFFILIALSGLWMYVRHHLRSSHH
jgi:hypothetical protein